VRDKLSLLAARERIPKPLTSGKGKVATTSPQYKTAARALAKFILELREFAQASTPSAETTGNTQTRRKYQEYCVHS